MLCSLLIIDSFGNKFLTLNAEEYLQEPLNHWRMWQERAARGDTEYSTPVHVVGRLQSGERVEHVFNATEISSMSLAEHRQPRPKKSKAPEAAQAAN